MRRTGIFAILALLLFAVAGVTAAQEGAFDGGQQSENAAVDGEKAREVTRPKPIKTEKTTPEKTSEQPTDKNPPKNGKRNDGLIAKGSGAPKDEAVDEPKPKEEYGNAIEAPAGGVEDEVQGKSKADGKGKAWGKSNAEGKGKG